MVFEVKGKINLCPGFLHPHHSFTVCIILTFDHENAKFSNNNNADTSSTRSEGIENTPLLHWALHDVMTDPNIPWFQRSIKGYCGTSVVPASRIPHSNDILSLDFVQQTNTEQIYEDIVWQYGAEIV